MAGTREVRELKDLSDEKEEDIMSKSSVAEASKSRNKQLVPYVSGEQHYDHVVATGSANELYFHSFGIEGIRPGNSISPPIKQNESWDEVSRWVDEQVNAARNTFTNPSIQLLVVETPRNLLQESKQRSN